MASGQGLIRIRAVDDAWDRRVRGGGLVSRSGRELEDVAPRPRGVVRGVSSFDPSGFGVITPRVYVSTSAPAPDEAKVIAQPEPSPAIRARPGLYPFGPFLPAADSVSAQIELPAYRVADLVRAVCQICECTRAQLNSPGRAAHIVKARQIGFWALKRFTQRSLPEIGRTFGGRDHTTALHGIRRADLVFNDLSIAIPSDPVEAIRVLHRANWPQLGKRPLIVRLEVAE